MRLFLLWCFVSLIVAAVLFTWTLFSYAQFKRSTYELPRECACCCYRCDGGS